MTLQLKPLFAGEIDRLAIDTQLDLSSFEFQGTHPLATPVKVKGEIVDILVEDGQLVEYGQPLFLVKAE